jgi:hypothetical protein
VDGQGESRVDITKMPSQALENMVFWEVITPEWRSEEVSVKIKLVVF